MANIIFTNKCNISCPYCFAAENNRISDEYAFDLLDTWKISNFLAGNLFKFCGGEPTINPNIIPALDGLLENNNTISILTNGLWPEKFQSYIEKMDVKKSVRIIFLFNILPPEFYTKEQYERLNRTLKIVNPLQATLGITIYKKDFEYDYLFSLCDTYNIRRIRWSICAPNINGEEYKLEKDFYHIAERLCKFLSEAESRNIKTHRDCGYIPPCFFKDKQLVDLLLKKNTSFQCSSSAVDIDKGNQAWRCYGLYSVFMVNIKDFKDELELQRYFNRRIKILDNLLNYKECKTCEFLHAGCGMGCYAIRIKKAKQIKPDICLSPVDDENEILNCCPVKVGEIIIAQEKERTYILTRNKVYENPTKEMLAILSYADGKTMLRQIIDREKENYKDHKQATFEIIKAFKRLFEMDLISAIYDFGLEYMNRPIAIN